MAANLEYVTVEPVVDTAGDSATDIYKLMAVHFRCAISGTVDMLSNRTGWSTLVG